MMTKIPDKKQIIKDAVQLRSELHCAKEAVLDGEKKIRWLISELWRTDPRHIIFQRSPVPGVSVSGEAAAGVPEIVKSIRILTGYLGLQETGQDPTVTRAKNSKENLCDTCQQSAPECEPEEGVLEFGDGVGHDNVVACSAYIAKREVRLDDPTTLEESDAKL